MSRQLPHGPPWPTSVQTLAWITRPKPFLRRAHARYGDVFTVKLLSGENFVMFAHPDAVKEILTGDPEVFRAGEGNRALLPVVGSRSVLELDGAEHLQTRRLMLPSFHGERMQSYRAIIEEAAEREVATWHDGEAIPLARRMQEVTLEVIMRAVFGVDDPRELGELRPRLMRALAWITDTGKLTRLILHPPETWPEYQPLKQALAPMHETLLEEARRRRAAPDLEEREDVLSMLLQARDEDGNGLSDEDLRDQLVTLLIAGHETTATALGWAFERLLRHPEAMRLAVEDAHDGDGAYLDAV
ncbi:MAG TPA: cytochrome P450, partial [Solirubrobacteraceae bacterium]